MKVTAPGARTVRSLHEICEVARSVNCGECWALPGAECLYTMVPASVPVTRGTPVRPACGYHVARFARAFRRGLITGPDLIAVLSELVVFTGSAVYFDVRSGSAS